MNTLRTQSMLAIAALVGVLILFGGVFNRDAVEYAPDSPSFNRAYWAQQMTYDGAGQAYQEFVAKNSEVPFARQHVATHVIGELLFEHYGASGVEFCGPEFGFGCYHGFFGLAVATEGAAIIPELDAACVAAYGPLGTGCQHGIGHGILEYVGYDRIDEALMLCRETTQLTTLLGCTSGVFMEYNTPLVGTGENEAPAPRAFDAKNPYVPCTTIGESFQESCYFELGQWYATILQGQYEKQHALCAGLSKPEHRLRCAMGLGAFFAPASGYDIERTLRHCAGANELACRAGASWSFYADPQVRAHADTLCAFPRVVQQEQCLALADLTEGLRHQTASP